MNKTISISLGGVLFNVEEDAYERLKKYLDDIKTYFASLDNQEEVVEDIEARIAEQLTERNNKDHKIAITLIDVEALIQTMGTIEDITGEHKNNTTNTNTTNVCEKRLYRDEDNAIIAGVCSGIAAYLDTDPVWVRLIFSISIFFGGAGLLIYLILWIAMPAAKTPTEKMEMRGKKITLAGVQETIKTASQAMSGKTKNAFEKLTQFIREILQRIFFVFGKIFKKIGQLIAILLGISIIIGSTAAMVGAFIITTLATLPWGNYYLDFPAKTAIHIGSYWSIALTGLLTVIIPLIFALILGISLLRRRLAFTLIPTITLLSIWVVSGTTLVVMVLSTIPTYNSYLEQTQTLPIISREYTEKFEQIKIRNVEKITVVAGPEYKVIASSTEISLDRMKFSTADGQLEIARKNSNKICLGCDSSRFPVEVYITAPSLKDIDISGASKIEITGFEDDQFVAHLRNGIKANLVLNTEKAILDIQHIDTVILSGTAQTLETELHGYGQEVLHAFDLKTSTTTLDLSGSNMLVEISVEKFLNVVSSGEGKVIYKGTPKIVEEFNKEALNELQFEYDGNSYPVKLRRIQSGDGAMYEIKIDDEYSDDIPQDKIVNLKINREDYTAQIRMIDDFDKIQLYDIKEAEVALPSIIEASPIQ